MIKSMTMQPDPANKAKDQTWRRRLRWLLLVSLSTGLLICLVNCTPQTRYKTLSFFFDGVPNPDAPNATDDRGGGSKGNSFTIASTHPPFDNENCGACHASSEQTGSMRGFDTFKKLTAEICSKCHAQVTEQFRYMHGPVVNGVCLMCHSPHESDQPHLLKLASPKVCLQCHQPNDLGPPIEAHSNPTNDCLVCHVGHGSSEHGLLRDTAMKMRTIKAPDSTSPQATPTPEPPGETTPPPATGEKL